MTNIIDIDYERFKREQCRNWGNQHYKYKDRLGLKLKTDELNYQVAYKKYLKELSRQVSEKEAP